jgi:hypothetical protein
MAKLDMLFADAGICEKNPFGETSEARYCRRIGWRWVSRAYPCLR